MHFLSTLSSFQNILPFLWWANIIFILELEILEALKKSNNIESRFVISKLLAKTNAWTGVEGCEDVGIWGEVLVNPGIDETHGIEFIG